MRIANNEFYHNQQPHNSSKVAVGNPSHRPKGKAERVDSKASNSHLVRKSRSPEDGPPSDYGRATHGQKPKDKTRKSTTRTTKTKRNTASNKHKGSPGFR